VRVRTGVVLFEYARGPRPCQRERRADSPAARGGAAPWPPPPVAASPTAHVA